MGVVVVGVHGAYYDGVALAVDVTDATDCGVYVCVCIGAYAVGSCVDVAALMWLGGDGDGAEGLMYTV